MHALDKVKGASPETKNSLTQLLYGKNIQQFLETPLGFAQAFGVVGGTTINYHEINQRSGKLIETYYISSDQTPGVFSQLKLHTQPFTIINTQNGIYHGITLEPNPNFLIYVMCDKVKPIYVSDAIMAWEGGIDKLLKMLQNDKSFMCPLCKQLMTQEKHMDILGYNLFVKAVFSIAQKKVPAMPTNVVVPMLNAVDESFHLAKTKKKNGIEFAINNRRIAINRKTIMIGISVILLIFAIAFYSGMEFD
jgi:hypothetical protein